MARVGRWSASAAGWRGLRAALLVMLLVGCVALLGAPAADAAQPQQAAQDGFVPMNDIPPEDQLPAAPLLVAAYSVVWAIAIGYMWTIWRRLGTVERELADVSRRISEREQSQE